MARAWKQYDAASNKWIDWPPGTLPSPESIFRAKFINQFMAWRKYIGAFQYSIGVGINPLTFMLNDPQNWNDIGAHNQISVGDVIQDAAFWNRLLFQPELLSPTERLSYCEFVDHDPAVITEQDAVLQIEANLYETSKWHDTSVSAINVGDDLQELLPEYLMKLRARYDLCKVARYHYTRNYAPSDRIIGADYSISSWGSPSSYPGTPATGAILSWGFSGANWQHWNGGWSVWINMEYYPVGRVSKFVPDSYPYTLVVGMYTPGTCNYPPIASIYDYNNIENGSFRVRNVVPYFTGENVELGPFGYVNLPAIVVDAGLNQNIGGGNAIKLYAVLDDVAP